MYDTLVSFSYKIKIHGADTTHEHNPDRVARLPGVNYCRNTCLHVGKNLLSYRPAEEEVAPTIVSSLQSHFRSVVDRAIRMQVRNMVGGVL